MSANRNTRNHAFTTIEISTAMCYKSTHRKDRNATSELNVECWETCMQLLEIKKKSKGTPV